MTERKVDGTYVNTVDFTFSPAQPEWVRRNIECQYFIDTMERHLSRANCGGYRRKYTRASARHHSLSTVPLNEVCRCLWYICICLAYIRIMFGRCGGCAIRATADEALRKANRIIERNIMSNIMVSIKFGLISRLGWLFPRVSRNSKRKSKTT